MSLHRPLNVIFLLTSMPVGGAETLLVNLVRRFDRSRINPLIGCLKNRDELGELISNDIPVYENLIRHKFDIGVLGRLKKLFRENRVDAVITVGAGDKMFWGRLAARQSKIPVVLSALHSTGWPDGVGRLNRILTRITDGFIAVAKDHAKYQIEQERFPAAKVFLIPNGIDTDRFQFDPIKRNHWRMKLNIPADAPVVGIVAALRSEKNHAQFLNAACTLSQNLPTAQFVIAGDGPERATLESLAAKLKIDNRVHFLGSITDVVGVLSMTDLFALTSHNEASPVSIMEAFSCQRPVVAPAVGSIHETVIDGINGFLVAAGDANQTASRWLEILSDPQVAAQMGTEGRKRVVEFCSLTQMTNGYVNLIEQIYQRKANGQSGWTHSLAPSA